MELGRIERRMASNMTARLETAAAPHESVRVVIENISGHGARVISSLHLQQNEHVVLIEGVGNWRIDASVVYCQPLHDEICAIGLLFQTSVPKPESLS